TNLTALLSPPGATAFQTSPKPPLPSRSTSRYPSIGSVPTCGWITIAYGPSAIKTTQCSVAQCVVSLRRQMNCHPLELLRAGRADGPDASRGAGEGSQCCNCTLSCRRMSLPTCRYPQLTSGG